MTTPNNTEQRNYLIFAACFILVSFLIMKSFLSGILWGGVIAMSVWPLFEKISSSKHRFLKIGVRDNALIFTLAFFFLFFTPIAYCITEFTNLYSAGQDYISNHTVHGSLIAPHFIQYLPMKEKILLFWYDNIATSSSLVELINKLTNGKLITYFSVVWGELFDRIITVAVMIVSLYFMLRNGEIVKKTYRDIFAHWIGEKSVLYIDNGIESLRGTINGVVLIGLIEGVLLSIPLILADVSAGALIGLAAGVLGVIPLLMPALILPCIGYIYLDGQEGWAIVSAIDLAIVWFIFENIIKPQIISQKVKINTFIILISMIGGMQLFGPVGLFLGPAIVSMAIGMVKDLLVVPKYNFNEHPITPEGKTNTENLIETIATVQTAIEKQN